MFSIVKTTIAEAKVIQYNERNIKSTIENEKLKIKLWKTEIVTPKSEIGETCLD